MANSEEVKDTQMAAQRFLWSYYVVWAKKYYAFIVGYMHLTGPLLKRRGKPYERVMFPCSLLIFL